MISTKTPKDHFDFHFKSFQEGHKEEGLKYYHSQYWKSLTRFVYDRCKDQKMAEDIVADAFLKLHQQRRRISDPSHLKSFLYTIARRGWINHLRSSKVAYKMNTEIRYLNEEIDVDFGLTKSALIEWIYQQFDKLPEGQREVMELLYISNMSFAEIAELKKCKVQTIRNQKTLAIANLKKMRDHTELILLLTFLSTSLDITHQGNEFIPSHRSSINLNYFLSDLVKNSVFAFVE